jgi:voltage-gated sodium channel
MHAFAKSSDWFRPFLAESTNLLDVCIVTVSVASLSLLLSGTELPSIKMLRLIRVGRVVRLVRKFKSLDRMLTATSSSVGPVCNALLLLLICTAVFATLGTHFFRLRSPEFFGDLLTSLFTMVQVLCLVPPSLEHLFGCNRRRDQRGPCRLKISATVHDCR